MSKRFGIIVLVISIIAIALSVTTLCVKLNPAKQEEDVQYVMFLGTNDKDTNEPVLSQEDAKTKAGEILLKYFSGYTMQDSYGGWSDGENNYHEYTIVIYLSDTDIDDVHLASDELIEEFNQSHILIQSNKTTTEFYEGSAAL